MILADLFFLSRPTLFFVNWIILLLGHHAVGGAGGPALWLLMVEYACISGAAVIVNQLHDLESDRENGKLFILQKGYVSESAALCLAWSLFALGALLAIGLGTLNFLLTLLFFALTGIVYNKPPLATKDRPLAGMLTLALACAALFVQSAALGGVGPLLRALPESLPILLACLGVGLLTTIPDMEGDAAAEKLTFARRYGVDRTYLAALASLLLCLLCSWMLANPFVGLPALGAVVLLLWGVFTRPRERAAAISRWAILLQALAVCSLAPFFGLLMIVYYAAARFYYRERFGIVYPRLGLDS